MANNYETDAAGLKAFDELRELREYLNKVAADLKVLANALEHPKHWTISGEHGGGYGENNASNIKLPELKVLGEKVKQYQDKHFDLVMNTLPKLGKSAKETIERQIEK